VINRGLGILTSIASCAALVGLAPAAHADDINRETCLAVMALGVNPYDPNDRYSANMLERYPDMTYNQAKALVETAFRSVRYHDNPMCNGVTIPADY
jgi:hypothetical protein